jgi:predicted PurR-regulated permease PerM
LWSVLGVITCLIFVLVVLGGVVLGVVAEVTNFNWNKYANSPRLKNMLEVISVNPANADNSIQESGTEPADETQDYGALLAVAAKGPLLGALGTMLSLLSSIFLMMLFLVFMLLSEIGNDPRKRLLGIGWKAKVSMQRYLGIKFIFSTAVSLLVWGVLQLYKVDLSLSFALITFALNYIPHIGYTMAVLAPLPLLFLDPTKTTGDIVACVVWPVLIHQVFSSLLEPRLLAVSLHLHPIVSLTSLVFWSVCWGLLGAVLSTPLICALMLVLQESRHPYARVIAGLLRGQVPIGKQKS